MRRQRSMLQMKQHVKTLKKISEEISNLTKKKFRLKMVKMILKAQERITLVVQWIGTHLSMQDTPVQSLV